MPGEGQNRKKKRVGNVGGPFLYVSWNPYRTPGTVSLLSIVTHGCPLQYGEVSALSCSRCIAIVTPLRPPGPQINLSACDELVCYELEFHETHRVGMK